ncbi:MAG: histone deacetylase [Opitutales bacterium]|nr:histone deacetylase [Opitutales bacterium]
MTQTAVIYHPDFDLHDTGPHHPERPERARLIAGALRRCDFADRLDWLQPEPVAVKHLERVHSPEYRQFIEESCLSGRQTADSGETAISEESYRIALLAAGASVRGIDAVLRDGYKHAFACSRPPGHHARYEQAMGFCLFNNIAIAASYAESQYGLDRICILDWDVHHGNGTQEAFYNSPRILFCSLHQMPLYPHTGESYDQGLEIGHGFTLNLPVPPQVDGEYYRSLIEEELEPEIDRFRPELILISAGFDAHINDPLADIRLQTKDFVWMTEKATQWAGRWADGRIFSQLEGGYHLPSLVEAATAHVQTLCR